MAHAGGAARAVGKSKPTIARAISSGKLSASRTETGEFAIDESELLRLYGVTRDGSGSMLRDVAPADGASLAVLRVKRDRLLIESEELAESIRNLRHRLDGEVGRGGEGGSDDILSGPIIATS